MKKRKSKIINIFTISLGLTSILASNALILASCSSSKKDDDERVDKGSGEIFADNEKSGSEKIISTLNDVAKESLSDENSMKKIFVGKIGDLFYKTIETIKKDNATFARDLENKNKEIDENLKELKDQAKKNDSSNWEKTFQDSQLDPNGGTEESWKKNKKNEWATQYLIDKIFEKNYSFVSNGSTLIKTPQLSDLMKALNKKDGYKFVWDGENDLEKNFYSKIQEFTFNKWLEFERPMIINMSLWKYGTPRGGINSIYNTNITAPAPEEENSFAIENYSTRDDIAANYEFPFFSSSSDNETFSTIEKFNNFISDSLTNPNYKLRQIGGEINSAGLIDIPFNYTEDSSTYILAKTSSIYNNLYPEFAMGALSLFYNKWEEANGLPLLKNDYNRTLDLTNSVLDPISKQFITSNISNIPAGMNKTTIPSIMVDKIINQFGDLTTLRNRNLYSIDAFKIKNDTNYNLDDFLLLRNEAGVHAISIDGYDYIKNISDSKAATKAYGDILLYRSILNDRGLTNLQGNTSLSINIKNELKTYFSENSEYILTQLLKDGSMSNLVDTYFKDNYLENNAAVENFFTNLSSYMFNIKNNNVFKNVQNKFKDTKEKYSNNFGENSMNNGFASPWIYEQNSTANGIYNILSIYNLGDVRLYGESNSYRERYLATINNYLNSIKVEKLISSESTFKFSQYIYSNNDDLNLSIKEFMTNNGGVFANKLKSEILSKDVSSYFENLTFTNLPNFNTSDLSTLNYQMINTYFTSTFDSIQGNKFADWRWLNNGKALDEDKILSSQDISDYKKKLFDNKFTINKNDIYAEKFDAFWVASTIKYLLEDPDNNNMNRFMEHLKNEVIFGKDYYFVWTDNINGKLEPSNRNIDTTALLNTNRMKINNNNNYASKYFSNSGKLLVDDASGNNLYNTSTYGVSDNHYNTMRIQNNTSTEYLGYSGLQSATNNSLPSIISQKLFNNQREGDNISDTSKGLLYQFGTKPELEEHIKSIKFISDLETLANDISRELSGSFDIDKIINAITIEQKKEEFLNQLNKIPNEAFQKFEGVVSKKILPDTSSSNYHGAYVKQLNFNDVNKDFSTFVNEQGSNIVYNLLIKTAMSDKYKNIVINEISQKNKFKVFDINAKNALGSLWIKEEEKK